MSTPPDLLAALRNVLSSDRIDGYRLSQSDTNLDLLERYFWNTALSETLYPMLQALEIALRNNTHEAASRRYSTSNWLTQQPSVLYPPEHDQVTVALGGLQPRFQ